jgi:hypothetical protein
MTRLIHQNRTAKRYDRREIDTNNWSLIINIMHRKTIDHGFLLIKIVVVAVIQISVVGFLDETATRAQVRLPQPFRACAILAIAVATSYPFTLMVDAAKRRVHEGLTDFDEFEALEPAVPSREGEVHLQIPASEIAKQIARCGDL